MKLADILTPHADSILSHPTIGFVRWAGECEGDPCRSLTFACGPERNQPLVVDDSVIWGDGWSLATEAQLAEWVAENGGDSGWVRERTRRPG